MCGTCMFMPPPTSAVRIARNMHRACTSACVGHQHAYACCVTAATVCTFWPRQHLFVAVKHRVRNQPSAAGHPPAVNGVQLDVPTTGAERDVDESPGSAPLALPTTINAAAPVPQRVGGGAPADVDLSGGAEPASGLKEAGALRHSGWTPAFAALAVAGGNTGFTRHRRGTFTNACWCRSGAVV